MADMNDMRKLARMGAELNVINGIDSVSVEDNQLTFLARGKEVTVALINDFVNVYYDDVLETVEGWDAGERLVFSLLFPGK